MSETEAHKRPKGKSSLASERAALSWLQDLGLRAEKLPESNDEKMPDILAEDSSDLRYLFEVKEKFPNPEKEKKRRASLDSGGVYSNSESTGRWNRLSGVIGEAVDQLVSPVAPPADFKLLFFVASGRDPKVQLDQLFNTAYGAMELLDLERGDSRVCLYYTHSDFYRYSADLDGILAINGCDVTLWVNALSPRANQLVRSELAEAMGNALYNPIALEAEDQVYVADTDLDRNKEKRGQILLYVQRKYDRWHNLTALCPVAFSAEAVVPSAPGSNACS